MMTVNEERKGRRKEECRRIESRELSKRKECRRKEKGIRKNRKDRSKKEMEWEIVVDEVADLEIEWSREKSVKGGGEREEEKGSRVLLGLLPMVVPAN